MLRGLRLEGSLEVSPLLDGNVSILPSGSCTSKPLGLIRVCWLGEIVEGRKVFIMSMARSRDISLNMFLMSSEIKHRVGGDF